MKELGGRITHRPNNVGRLPNFWGVLLALFALINASPSLGQSHAAADTSPLRTLADERGFYIAAATSLGELNSAAPAGGPSVAQVVAREFNMMAPEGELEFGSLEPTPPTFNNGQLVPSVDPAKDFNFAPAEAMIQAAVQNHQVARGFSLLDYHSAPRWLTNCPPSSPHWPIDCGPVPWTPDELRQILQYHIQTVITYFKNKYPGVLVAWVVVNEPEYDNTNSGGSTHRASVFSLIPDSTGQPGGYLNYYKLAFQYAHQADPDALLGLNDDHDDDLDGSRIKGLYAVVKYLQAAGAPISFVGLESHHSLPSWLGTYSLSTQEIMVQTMKRYADLGLKVMITEADLAIPMVTQDELSALPLPPPVSAPSYWNAQADAYNATFSACILSSNCFAYITWGLNPLHSYLNSPHNELLSYDLPAPYSSDGLLFDGSNNPKPAYTAMHTALANSLQSALLVPAKNMVPASAQTAVLVTNSASRYYNDYQLLANGSTYASISVPQLAAYDFHVRAAGVAAGATVPQLQLSVDGHPLTTFSIASAIANDYISGQVDLPAGNHQISFLCTLCTQSANAYLDRFWAQPSQPFSHYMTGASFSVASGSATIDLTSAALMTVAPGSSIQQTISVPVTGNYQLTLAAYAQNGLKVAPYAQVQVDAKTVGTFKVLNGAVSAEFPVSVDLAPGSHTITVLVPGYSTSAVFVHHVIVVYRPDRSIEFRGVNMSLSPYQPLSFSGNPSDVLNSPGASLQARVTLPTAGMYSIALTIAGREISLPGSPSQWAQGQLYVDSTLIGSFAATSDSWQTTSPFPVQLTAGNHTISVRVTNQGEETPSVFLNERNLSVQNVTITPQQ